MRLVYQPRRMSVLIRQASEADAAAAAAIYRPYVEESRISFEQSPPDAAEMALRMQSPLHPWLVAEDEGRIVGFASCSPYHRRPAYRWTVETSIYLAQDAQGRGLGRALLSALIGLVTRQGYVTAIAAIALPNPISVSLHERLGFTAAGTYRGVGFKLGQWTDVGLWQRDLAPRSASPADPLPFGELT
ncbi:MAG: N-acetyltransferase family protein [Bacillota bacterium]